MMADLNQVVAIVTLTMLLILTGVGAFFWMGMMGWADMPGMSVGVIFVLFGIMQAVFSVAWFRMEKRVQEEKSSLEENAVLMEMKDLKDTAPTGALAKA